MRKTIYKWSQYYLMYSPIWKELTKAINQTQKYSHNSYPNQYKEYNKEQQALKNEERQRNSNLIQKITTGNVFNIRLSVAYKVLFDNKLMQEKSKYLSAQLKTRDGERDEIEDGFRKISTGNMQESATKAEVYWLSQKNAILREISQILVQVKNSLKTPQVIHPNMNTKNVGEQKNRYDNNKGIKDDSQSKNQNDIPISRLLKILDGKNEEISQTSGNVCTQPNEQQDPLKQTQRFYPINQLNKRVIINQLITLIKSSSQETYPQDQPKSQSLFNDFQSHQKKDNKIIQDIDDRTLLVRLTIGLLQEIMTRRLPYLEEEQANDWLNAIVVETSFVKILADQVIRLVAVATFPSKDQEANFSFKQIDDIFEAYRLFESFLFKLRNVLKENSQGISKLLISPWITQQLQRTILQYNRNKTNKKNILLSSGYQELQRANNLSNLISTYVSIVLGNVEQDQFFTMQKKLQRHAKQPKQNIKQVRQRFSRKQFYLWKLTAVIKAKHQLILFQKQYSVGMEEIDSLVIKQLQRQAQWIMNQLQRLVMKDKTRMESRKNSNILSPVDAIYLSTIVDTLMSKYKFATQGEEGYSSLFWADLVKLNNYCHTKVLSCNFQDSYKQEGQVVLKETQQLVELLYSVVFKFNVERCPLSAEIPMGQRQIDDLKVTSQEFPPIKRILEIMRATKFISKLVKTLHKLTVTQNQYIILKKGHIKKLKDSIEYLVQINSRISFLEKDDLAFMIKMQQKLK